jgi:hypothetical protein
VIIANFKKERFLARSFEFKILSHRTKQEEVLWFRSKVQLFLKRGGYGNTRMTIAPLFFWRLEIV